METFTPLHANRAVRAAEAELGQHPVYSVVRDLQQLQLFTEHHVIAVLDFMALLKSIEHDIVPRRTAWVPLDNPRAGRLLHEIVLDEETEQLPDGRVLSHFDWYLEAMEEIGADTAPIRDLVRDLRAGTEPGPAIERSRLPAPAKAFGSVTFGFLEAPTHVRAAVFFHGRENVIPAMFLPLARHLRASGTSCETLVAYLERHVELDGEDHGPRAAALLEGLYRGNADLQAEAEAAALQALAARRALWDGVVEALGDPADS